MKSMSPFRLVLSPIVAWLLLSVGGCSQPDNPTPVKATPPPAPKPEETKEHKDKTGKAYGAGERYKKAMNKGRDTSAE